MNTDRFNSNEDVKFDTRAELEGMEARRLGFSLDDCPYIDKDFPLRENFFMKSWRAGWVDTDMILNKKCKKHKWLADSKGNEYCSVCGDVKWLHPKYNRRPK